MRTSTSGASDAASRANCSAGVRSPRRRARRCRTCPNGSGSRSKAGGASAPAPRRAGSRCPGPTFGPQPATGMSATSSGAERGHAVEQLRVAREVDRAGAAKDEAERGHGTARPAAAVRRGRHSRRRPGHARRPRRRRPVDLVDVVKPAEEAPRATRHDESHVPADAARATGDRGGRSGGARGGPRRGGAGSPPTRRGGGGRCGAGGQGP